MQIKQGGLSVNLPEDGFTKHPEAMQVIVLKAQRKRWGEATSAINYANLQEACGLIQCSNSCYRCPEKSLFRNHKEPLKVSK